MSERSREIRRRSKFRTAGLLALFACGFLFLGWSIFWAVAHRAAVSELDFWLTRESASGRVWACGAMTTGGYPFSIDIECDRPSLRLASNQDSITAGHASIKAPLYTPKLVIVDVNGPLVVSFGSSATQIRADWKALQFSTRGLPDRLDRLSVSGEQATVESRFGAAASTTKIAALHGQWKRASMSADAPYNVSMSLAGVESPLLDAVAGARDQAIIAATGAVTQVDRAIGGTLAERIDAWRSAGGRVGLQLLAIRKGPISVQAEGAFGLDQTRRLDGKVDFQLDNASVVFNNLGERFGLNAAAIRMLGALLGPSTPGGEMRIGVAFENGAVSVGPLKGIVTLPPLY
jgi:hypothetical protein